MSKESKNLELCKEVLVNSAMTETDCSNISCGDCPFMNLTCSEDITNMHRIVAQDYINKHDGLNKYLCYLDLNDGNFCGAIIKAKSEEETIDKFAYHRNTYSCNVICKKLDDVDESYIEITN